MNLDLKYALQVRIEEKKTHTRSDNWMNIKMSWLCVKPDCRQPSQLSTYLFIILLEWIDSSSFGMEKKKIKEEEEIILSSLEGIDSTREV
jgi:hypothetical protein